MKIKWKFMKGKKFTTFRIFENQMSDSLLRGFTGGVRWFWTSFSISLKFEHFFNYQEILKVYGKFQFDHENFHVLKENFNNFYVFCRNFVVFRVFFRFFRKISIFLKKFQIFEGNFKFLRKISDFSEKILQKMKWKKTSQ